MSGRIPDGTPVVVVLRGFERDGMVVDFERDGIVVGANMIDGQLRYGVLLFSRNPELDGRIAEVWPEDIIRTSGPAVDVKPLCDAVGEDGFLCCRAAGHGGRFHVATFGTGDDSAPVRWRMSEGE